MASSLSVATGLDENALALVAKSAAVLNSWRMTERYTELRCDIPVLGRSTEGAEIPGTIDLVAIGREGCLLIGHKSGGEGLGR